MPAGYECLYTGAPPISLPIPSRIFLFFAPQFIDAFPRPSSEYLEHVEYVSFDTMYVYVMNDLSRLQSRSRMRKDGNFEIPTLGSSNKPYNGEGREKQSVSLQGNFCGNQSSTVVRPRGAREGNDLADLLNVFNDTSKEGRSLSVLVRCPRRSPLSYEQSTANRSLWSIYVRVIKTRNRRG